MNYKDRPPAHKSVLIQLSRDTLGHISRWFIIGIYMPRMKCVVDQYGVSVEDTVDGWQELPEIKIPSKKQRVFK
jgi:hypothetical protein